MLELSDESIQLNRTRECHLHKHRIIARHTIALNHIRNAFYKRIGQLELNAFEPVIFYTLFESIEALGHAAQTLTDNCILGITANEKHCKDLVNASAGIATALCPSIGYAASAALAKESLKTNVPVRTLAVTKGYVTETEADKLLDPYTMTGKRLEKSSCYNYKKAATLGI